MTVYYVGPGGNDANSGLNWGARKLTLNGAENVPVVAGDTVYVAPGVYRELLTCDVSGGAGSPITYIGDVSGENTDGVGGVVRVTGSDNDQTAARASCVVGTVRNYRTFRGFAFDTCSSHLISFSTTGATNCIIEDCTFDNTSNAAIASISCQGANQAAWTVRRCFMLGGVNTSYGVYFSNGADVSNPNHIVEDCTILGG